LNEDRDFIELEVGSGVLWNGFINWCLERNYFGLENLTHIPGCVGAAPVQNIGAYGAEISQVIQEVRGIFTKTSEEKIFSKGECHFKYRSSIFKEVYHNQFIITSVLFKLSKKHEPNLKFHEVRKRLENLNIAAPTAHEIRNVIHEIRQEKLPDPARLGNAGSFFKNPEITKQKLMALKNEFPEINSYPIPDAPEKVKISAAFLIEKCAWKGKVYGHCGVYDKQPLVLVNLANALGQEIWELAQLIMQDVQTRFAIQLETEVNIIGPGF
jgi:UDP-N-acetylmuramate dehydrogenase